MFPFDVMRENCVLVAKSSEAADLWHLRYDHLNIKGLQLLGNRNMVFGLHEINALCFCEGCVYGKKCIPSFLVGKAWSASNYLELIHTDLCGPMSLFFAFD